MAAHTDADDRHLGNLVIGRDFFGANFFFGGTLPCVSVSRFGVRLFLAGLAFAVFLSMACVLRFDAVSFLRSHLCQSLEMRHRGRPRFVPVC